MKIVVLAGGLSPERDVSLSSGSLIANALREVGHNVLLIDLYEGIPGAIDSLDSLFKDNTGEPYKYLVPENEPNLEELKQINNNGNSLIGPNVIEVCKFADIVFIALHGDIGENGQIQATFDVLGIKYTGTRYIGSLLAMNKDLSKRLMKEAGILTADWIIVKDNNITLDYITKNVGLPCVVKPCSSGSSIGISIVDTIDELEEAIKVAKKVEDELLIEKKISGREFSVGILDGKALPAIEIIPKSGFYDYKNKYQPDFTVEICPANLSKADTEKIQDIALKTHEVLNLGSYSRIDFILDDEGNFYCLEANTLPGMTPTSLLPQEALALNISYSELCNRIVQLSFNR